MISLWKSKLHSLFLIGQSICFIARSHDCRDEGGRAGKEGVIKSSFTLGVLPSGFIYNVTQTPLWPGVDHACSDNAVLWFVCTIKSVNDIISVWFKHMLGIQDKPSHLPNLKTV